MNKRQPIFVWFTLELVCLNYLQWFVRCDHTKTKFLPNNPKIQEFDIILFVDVFLINSNEKGDCQSHRYNTQPDAQPHLINYSSFKRNNYSVLVVLFYTIGWKGRIAAIKWSLSSSGQGTTNCNDSIKKGTEKSTSWYFECVAWTPHGAMSASWMQLQITTIKGNLWFKIFIQFCLSIG